MTKAIKMINELFEITLQETDLKKSIDELVMWNSFEIFMFCANVEEKLQIRVNIDDLLEVVTIEDLVLLVGKWLKYSEERNFLL